MMPDVSQAQNLVKAMQGVMSSGGSAFTFDAARDGRSHAHGAAVDAGRQALERCQAAARRRGLTQGQWRRAEAYTIACAGLRYAE